jgi:hypothetical protein
MIVPDLSYNREANQAYAEVAVFKFADRPVTYFQCAVSTCAIAEGLCTGKTVSQGKFLYFIIINYSNYFSNGIEKI